MDLSTTYLGLKLDSPLVPSASPLSEKISNLRAMEDAGAGAVVLHSLFEEQIKHDQLELDHYLVKTANANAEAVSYFPDLGNYKLGPEEYLEHVRKAKAAVKIPVIASLNGVSDGGWIDYATKLEEAGADAIEMNLYYVATDPTLTGSDIEQRYVSVLRAVKQAVKVPVAMKLSPFFTSVANMATRLSEAGADGLVLFNRFYQPDIDIDAKQVQASVELSTSDAARLPMRWIAILHGRITASLAASSGVHTYKDALKMLMAGADVTMMTSALLKNGVAHLGTVRRDMVRFMDQNEYASVKQLQGSMSQRSCAEPAAYERANYMKALASFK